MAGSRLAAAYPGAVPCLPWKHGAGGDTGDPVGNVLRAWPIGLAGIVLGVAATAAKEWLGGKAKLLLDFLYARLAGNALLRRTALAKYTRALYLRHRRFAVSFQVDDDLRLPMEQVYVPLRSARTEGAPGELAANLRDEPHSVVLGVPGAGKTMLLRHEALMWARQRIRVRGGEDRADRMARTGQRALRVNLRNRRDIPVLLELHRLNKEPELGLEQHIVRHFERHEFPRADKWVARALERGELALYFDGLDEVTTELRPRAVDQIKDFIATYPDCRTVVTCRVAVYDGWFADDVGQTLRVRDFDEHLIRRFLNGWPWRVGTAEDTVDQVLGALRDTPQIMALARNPLLLTMIAYLYDFVYAGTEHVLPHTRAEFYKEVIDSLLIDRRRQPKFSLPLKKAVLQQLALAAQDIPSGTHDRLALPESEVLRTTRRVLQQQGRDPAVAEDVLKEIVERSGLLLAVDNGERYQFAHLTLQEYLAAVALAADPAGLLRRYEGDPAAWREAVRLWCGVEPRDSTEVVQAVFGRDRVLAFQCLADAGTVDDRLAEQVLEHFTSRLRRGDADEQVIAAFGLVAGDRRQHGMRVFNFLTETLRSNPAEPVAAPERRPHADAAARALAATNLPMAAATLASTAQPVNPAWRALPLMGDLAVPLFAYKAAEYPEAVRQLWSIRTPKAALALNHLLWHDRSPETLLMCAFHLGELITVPEIAAELRTAQVRPEEAQYLDWVWRPFAQGPDDALAKIAGRIAAIINGAEATAFAGLPDLPPPDPRITAALVVIDDSPLPSVEPFSRAGDAPEAAADWYARNVESRGPVRSRPSADLSAFDLAQALSEAAETEPSALPYATAALSAAGLSPRRSALLSLLPASVHLAAIRTLLRQPAFAGTQSWDALPRHTEPTRDDRSFDYNTSPHYRFILLICLAVSGLAAWRAFEAATGDRPWGPAWPAAAALAQITIAWLVLIGHGILTNHWVLAELGIMSGPTLLFAITDDEREGRWALATLGLVPAAGVYSFVAVMEPWGVPAAIGVIVLATAVCVVARKHADVRKQDVQARTHPVRELVLKPLL